MTMYLIKVTHLEGIHKGRHYILTKDGYVSSVEETGCVSKMDCYKTLGGCKRACKAKRADNELMNSIDKRDVERRIEQGKSVPEHPILHELESYEPYEVHFEDTAK